MIKHACAAPAAAPPRSLLGIAQLRQALAQLLADQVDRADQPFARRHVVGARIDREARDLAAITLPSQRIEQRQIDSMRVLEQLDAHRLAAGFGREDIDHIAAHAVGAGRQIHVVARVLHFRQAPQQPALVDALAAHQVQHHRQVGLRVAQAVDRTRPWRR